MNDFVELPELPDDDVLCLVRHRFEQTPLNKIVPCELVELSTGVAVVRLEPNRDHCNGSGILHGGIISTLLDTCGWLAGVTMAKGRLLIVADLQISFIDLSVDEALIATGTTIRAAAQLIYTEMELRTESGRLLAKALGTHQKLPRMLR